MGRSPLCAMVMATDIPANANELDLAHAHAHPITDLRKSLILLLPRSTPTGSAH